MDSLAHYELVSPVRLDAGIWSDDDRLSVISVAGSIATYRTQHNKETPVDRRDEHASHRALGARAYAALCEFSHRPRPEVHRFLAALNVRGLDRAQRYQIALCLSKKPPPETALSSLRDALLDLDVMAVEKLCPSKSRRFGN
jgi:hypothetical protein